MVQCYHSLKISFVISIFTLGLALQDEPDIQGQKTLDEIPRTSNKSSIFLEGEKMTTINAEGSEKEVQYLLQDIDAMIGSAHLESDSEALTAMNTKQTEMGPIIITEAKRHWTDSFAIFAIGLDHRKKHILNFFRTLGLKDSAIVVSGIRPESLNQTSLQLLGRLDKEYTISGETVHSPLAEVATTYAHLKAIQRFLRTDAEYGVIFEDDAIFVDNYKLYLDGISGQRGATFMEMISRLVHRAPAGWDEINMGRCVSKCAQDTSLMDLADGIRMVKSPEQFCSSAYIINRKSARYLAKLFSQNLRFSNDKMKAGAFDKGEYQQYSISPRLFRQDGRCGVNGCQDRRECMEYTPQCKEWRQPCEWTQSCTSVDIASPLVPEHAAFAKAFPEAKLAALEGMRTELKKKHLRIRSVYAFLDQCSFFTFPLGVINQLKVAEDLDLIGDKKPFVYMPEDTQYHDCASSNLTAAEAAKTPDFWEKWFRPISDGLGKDADESEVWEFSQHSIVTAFYHLDGVHAYPYSSDEDVITDTAWISRMRAKAYPIVEKYIRPNERFVSFAKSTLDESPPGTDPYLIGVHMRGSEEYVHARVDPSLYIYKSEQELNTHPTGKLFLATDDRNYTKLVSERFGKQQIWASPQSLAEQKLADVFKNSKDRASAEVLMDSILLAMSSKLIKCWSAVSEFAVYFRRTLFPSMAPLAIVDLEAANQVQEDKAKYLDTEGYHAVNVVV
mmetsp:Transcript_19044/g.30267  ORF Transcript_19044/g.30267 Transcript_19044/m.30267 type:complete len:728 (+) Transcript_19044:101-2284(+)